MQDDFEELLEVNDEVQELMGRSYGYAPRTRGCAGMLLAGG